MSSQNSPTASSPNSPVGLDASRQQWEILTWLMLSKESQRRNIFPSDAYDERGMLKQSHCPDLYREVHTKFEVDGRDFNKDLMPVIHVERNNLTIEWVPSRDYERLQRITDAW